MVEEEALKKMLREEKWNIRRNLRKLKRDERMLEETREYILKANQHIPKSEEEAIRTITNTIDLLSKRINYTTTEIALQEQKLREG